MLEDDTDLEAPPDDGDPPEEASGDFCPDYSCHDHADLVFRPDEVGQTCGGLWLRGWDQCPACGRFWLAERGARQAYDAGPWQVPASGRSITCGSIKLRPEAGGAPAAELRALLERIAMLPHYEAVVRAAVRGDADALAAAVAAARRAG